MTQTRKLYPGRARPTDDDGVRFVPVTKIEKRVTGEGAKQRTTYNVAVSSEEPVDRFDWWTGRTYREVLGHDAKEVQMRRFKSGRAAVLEEHRGVPVGVVDAASLDSDKVLRSDIRFSRGVRGTEAQQDVEDEIRTNISVGYIPKRAKLIDENGELGDLWRVTLWEPVELSLVGVPADVTVGVGRNASGGGLPLVEVEDDGEPVIEGERDMKIKKVRNDAGGIDTVVETDPRTALTDAEVTAITSARTQPTVADTPAPAARPERSGFGDILRVAAENHVPDATLDDWFARGLTEAQMAHEIVKTRRLASPRTPAQPGAEQLNDREQRDMLDYSYLRAVRMGCGLVIRERAQDPGSNPEIREQVRELGRVRFDGIEAEKHQEIFRNLPEGADYGGGILVPMRTGHGVPPPRSRFAASGGVQQRTTLTTLDPTKGVESVPMQYGDLIEYLRARALVIASGARVLSGLTGPIAFPKQTSGATVVWVPENPSGDVADGEPALGLSLLSPKTLQGNIPFTRQLLLQSSLDVEAWVRDEIGIGHGLAIDLAALHGRGNNGEPGGVYATGGVNSTDFLSAYAANMTIANLIGMAGQISDKNADVDVMRWLTTPLMAAKQRATLEFAAAGSRTLWTGNLRDGDIAGYGASSTTQCSKVMSGSLPTGGSGHALVFGNWSDVFIGLFGAMELLPDPYSRKKRAIIEVTSFQMSDVMVRHGESFAKGVNATITG